MRPTILCLGNEFIEEDSLAKKISEKIENEFDIINIKDIFQLIPFIQNKDDLLIIDVVKNLTNPTILKIKDLKQSSINTAHDLDASFFLQVLSDKIKKIKIIGIPAKHGNEESLMEEIKKLLL